LKLTKKELLFIKQAKDVVYKNFNELTNYYKSILAELYVVVTPESIEKLEKERQQVLEKIKKEVKKIRKFWEATNKRYKISHPWQLEVLLNYSKSFSNNQVIEFNF